MWRSDAEARIARVQAGADGGELVDAAAAHGLAALAGSARSVGVAGYALSGGISWLGRKHGLAANSVEAVELVTADGRIVRSDRENESDLFWALRGGGGGFGVVSALELRLLPLTEIYAGILWWPIERGQEVLHAWRELTWRGLPDELTTVGRFLRFPPIPEIPEDRRGRAFVLVEAFHLGDPAEADALLAPLRALGPETDTIETIPARALVDVHMDPPQPVPAAGDGFLLGELPAAAVDELVRVAGGPGPSPLVNVEVRHLGGELGRARGDGGALPALDAEFALVAVGMAPAPEQAAAARARIGELSRALAPWTAPRASLNFADTRRDPRAFWDERTYERLRRIKAEVDPDDIIMASHPVA
jgi:hypothetical protein